MTATKHNGSFSYGDVLGYDSYGTFYGVKVLDSMYVGEDVDAIVYIVQSGSAKEGEDFRAYGSPSLNAYTKTDLLAEYGYKYTKSEELKDGDVLMSSDRKHVFVVRGKMTTSNVPKLYRVTGGAGNFDSRQNYENTYGKLTLAQPSYTDKRFSDPVK